MSCFKILATLCHELEKLLAKFWWGQKKSKHKIHWIIWSKMCIPKSEGGMDFKDLKAFNKDLLAKQGWRIMQDESSLLHKVYKAKYFKQGQFLDEGYVRLKHC